MIVVVKIGVQLWVVVSYISGTVRVWWSIKWGMLIFEQLSHYHVLSAYWLVSDPSEGQFFASVSVLATSSSFPTSFSLTVSSSTNYTFYQIQNLVKVYIFYQIVW